MECKTLNCDNVKLRYGSKCREHYNESMRVYTLNRYHTRRAYYIGVMGGKCVDCGSADSLEFDHVDRSKKSFTITSSLTGGSKKRIEEELLKCVLRCKDCHRVKTTRESSVEHGGGLTGRRNCRCDLCRPLKNAYMLKKGYKRRN